MKNLIVAVVLLLVVCSLWNIIYLFILQGMCSNVTFTI